MNEFHLTYVVRGVRPEREPEVREALAEFIESEGLYIENGDEPWEIDRAGPGELRVESMSHVRMRATGYKEQTEKHLSDRLGDRNGAPCEVQVTVVDAQFLDQDDE